MKLSISIKGKLELYTDLYDICFECSQKKHCPLIGAIKSEVVVPRYETIEIVRCGMFKSYRTTPNTPLNICKKYLKNITDEILKLKIFNFEAGEKLKIFLTPLMYGFKQPHPFTKAVPVFTLLRSLAKSLEFVKFGLFSLLFRKNFLTKTKLNQNTGGRV